MSRASRADAARHREEVVHATARLLRERGSGASLSDIMSTVGLTPGGFYKHFASKDELLGIAAGVAFGELLERMRRLAEEFPEAAQARDALLREYLSVEHRDSPGTGCANTALASDAARAGDASPLRKEYERGAAETLRALASLRTGAAQGEGEETDEALRGAILDLTAMVGALTLARATGGSKLSDMILQVVHDDLRA
ncbi:TetR family transcriptional regulator [Streptomyces sulfonofaciens]|uniref:TetR family transcriptional regulator n=1 Tax=Streptomyces sulfonofaciens TaxID=68272 RepID=A0A919GEP2_9ACTN|nr:TetR family transcriptional regulator [Streptomyces sulfonofaciens]GHH82803.1 TetR family transcriptional regulator [Streptomyces sulfonofaciens]